MQIRDLVEGTFYEPVHAGSPTERIGGSVIEYGRAKNELVDAAGTYAGIKAAERYLP